MFFINPFIYAAGADFESIATVTVGSGGASSIEFTSIPGTYQHLQIRTLVRVNGSGANGNTGTIYVNGNTENKYSTHFLLGNGSAASAGAAADLPYGLWYNLPGTSQTSSVFGAFVIDILDYASTSKTTVIRYLGGWDSNGSGRLYLESLLWNDTSAVSSFKLEYADLVQHSTAALYGIKAP